MSTTIFRVQPAGRDNGQERKLQKRQLVILTGRSNRAQRRHREDQVQPSSLNMSNTIFRVQPAGRNTVQEIG